MHMGVLVPDLWLNIWCCTHLVQTHVQLGIKIVQVIIERWLLAAVACADCVDGAELAAVDDFGV